MTQTVAPTDGHALSPPRVRLIALAADWLSLTSSGRVRMTYE
jgi:hypothetical protein